VVEDRPPVGLERVEIAGRHFGSCIAKSVDVMKNSS
jgi:hypothetical protein